MKLSYRDKVILLCVIVVIVLVAGFFVFIKPAAANSDTAKLALEQKQAEQAEVQAKIDTLPTLIETLKSTAETVDELQMNFLDDQLPYQNEQMLHEILAKDGVEIISMNVSYTSEGSKSEYMVYPKNVLAYELQINSDLYHKLPQEVYDKYNKVPNPSGATAKIAVTSVTIGYTEPYDIKDVLSFVDTIAGDDRTMTVLAISTGEKPEDNRDIEGTISMNLYSVNKMDTTEIKEETEEKALEAAAEQQAAATPAEETPAA